jgi:hypothetical protein
VRACRTRLDNRLRKERIMKAPLTGNSITDRVVYTGLYVPEPAHQRAHEAQAAPVAGAAAERDGDAGEMALDS